MSRTTTGRPTEIAPHLWRALVGRAAEEGTSPEFQLARVLRIGLMTLTALEFAEDAGDAPGPDTDPEGTPTPDGTRRKEAHRVPTLAHGTDATHR